MMQDAVSPTASDEAVVRVTDRRASFALPGLILAGGALLCAIATLLMLLGLTPVAPTSSVVFTSVVINGMFVLGLMALIAREVREEDIDDHTAVFRESVAAIAG